MHSFVCNCPSDGEGLIWIDCNFEQGNGSWNDSEHEAYTLTVTIRFFKDDFKSCSEWESQEIIEKSFSRLNIFYCLKDWNFLFTNDP